MIVFEDYFNEQLKQEKWFINREGHISGKTESGRYIATDTETNWIDANGENKGNQHEAKVPLPENFRISFEIMVADVNPTKTGAMGFGLVNKRVEGFEQNEDGLIWLFVGQADDNPSSTEPLNYISSIAGIQIMDGSWEYRGSTHILVNPLELDYITTSIFAIEKEDNVYSIYKNGILAATTTFDHECRGSIIAGRTDPCLYFIDSGQINNLIIEAI
jgi:hypothetical protein